MKRLGIQTRTGIAAALFALIVSSAVSASDLALYDDPCEAPVDAILPREATPAILVELKSQVCRTFAEKFAIVTSDLGATSRSNLAVIGQALRKEYGNTQFERLWEESARVLPTLKARLVIQSETGLEAAVSILNSGAFLSRDELVRRKIVQLSEKMHGATRYNIDGRIGQQDAIFLAIKPVDIRPGYVGSNDYVFGNVKFIFDESVLEDGYFTTYPFDQSPGQFRLQKKEVESGQDLAGAIALYRRFVFKGEAAFDDLLRLSWIEAVSGASDPVSVLPQEVLGAYPRFPLALGLEKPLEHVWSFWELKVPTQLSLDHLRSIQIRKYVPDSDRTTFIDRVRAFAARRRKQVKVSEGFDQFGYDLMQARGAQVDREYYSFVRLDLY